jgi:hypothetical protein
MWYNYIMATSIIQTAPVVTIPDPSKIRKLDADTLAGFQAHQVIDDQSAATAADYIKFCKELVSDIESVFAQPKKNAHQLHKWICDGETKATLDAKRCIAILDGKIKSYILETRRKAAELEAKLRKEAEERAAQEAEQRRLEEETRDPWEDEENAFDPLAVTYSTPTIAPPPLPAGVSTRKGRDSYEITDLQLLIKAAANNPELAEALMPNDQYLKHQASILKQTLSDRFPGVKYVCKEHTRY